MLRIAFVLPYLEIGGGNSVALAHARSAARAGHSVTIALSGAADSTSGGLTRGLRVATLEQATRSEYDIAIASWWQDVVLLPRLTATRYIHFVQGPEDRLYTPGEDCYELVRDVYRIPLFGITVSSWLGDYLRSTYGRDRLVTVRTGLEKTVFAREGPAAVARSPDRLRVLVEGPLGVTYKNVVEALRLSRAIADETWLLTSTRVGPIAGVDRVFSRIAPLDVAAVYRSCDVLLKLSMVEGFSLPPLEMFHCGGTSVVFQAGGESEYVENGRNALAVPAGDFRAAAQCLSVLRGDRALLDRLKGGARDTAAAWPSEAESGERFLAVIGSVLNDSSQTDAHVLDQLRPLAGLVTRPRRRARDRIRDYSLVRSLRHSAQVRLSPRAGR